MVPTLNLDKDSQVPLYWQLYLQLRQTILGGELSPGVRLPASRNLAKQYKIARITVTQAYDQLLIEGFVVSRVGAGTFVAEGLPTAGRTAEKNTAPFQPVFSIWGQRILDSTQAESRTLARPQIDFGFGRSYPHIFPYDIWRRLLDRYLSTDDVMLSRYGSVAGFFPLRQALADYLRRQRGVHCRPEQVIIVSGAQQALDILSRLLLKNRDEVLVESPGYAAAFRLFRTHGAKVVGLPVDEQGFPVENIPADSRANLVFVTPSNQFPSGGTMLLPRRLVLLQWARTHDALIIEDDYDGELRYDGRPLTTLQGFDEDGRVVYLGAFSKVLFPALRLSYVVLPKTLIAPFVKAKAIVDRGAPTLTQAAVADFITEGHFDRHLRHLRKAYGKRREVLVHALEKYLPDPVYYSKVSAGLHVMLHLKPELDENDIVRKAAQVGVGIYPGAPYYLEQPAPPSILLGFSGLTEAEIDNGIRKLATIL